MQQLHRITGRDPKGWYWDPDNNCLIHPNFGRIQIVAVHQDDKWSHDRVIIIQHYGEHYVVVNEEGKIGFIEIERVALLPPESYLDSWLNWRETGLPHPVEISKIGVTELELPKGLALTQLQEAEEETRHKVELVVTLGPQNPDTSLYGTSAVLHVCKALPVQTNIPEDEKEGIQRVLWLPPKVASEVVTLDAATYAGLWRFRRWAKSQTTLDNGFWKDIGMEL